MNYIRLINDFWTMNEVHAFNSNEMALYFYLLRVNNLCSWKASFNHNNQKILATIGVSFNTFKSARNKLKQAGLIDFKTKNGSANVSYSLLTSSNFDKVLDEVTDEVVDEVTAEVSSSKDKLNKTKPKEAPPASVISLEARKQNFEVAVRGFSDKYASSTLRDFFNYWCEGTPSGKKMRFELEKTWDTNLRLQTWRRNEDKFGTKKSAVPSGDFVIGQKHNAAG